MVMTKQVQRNRIFALTASLMLTATGTAFAGWKDQINANDVERLATIEQSREAAIQEAEHGHGIGDFQAIKDTFEPQSRGVPEQALYGNWRCRQMKLGGMSDYRVYSWFNCRISRVNGGIWFEKSGTQRMAGYLHPENGTWVYLGAQSAKNEPLHRYSGNGPSLGASSTQDDQVGVLSGIGYNRLRLSLPSPAIESTFDAIELVR
jgi:hypothetical protein